MSDLTPFPVDPLTLAERLARPVTFLRFGGNEAPVATWQGEPSVPLPEHLVVSDEDRLDEGDFFEHWISVDAARLPHALPGCVSVYLNRVEDQVIALYDSGATLWVDPKHALYGQVTSQVPHLDALFRHGPADFQAWVAQEVKRPVEQLLTWSELPLWQVAVLSDIDQRLRKGHPMWAQKAPVAQLGGWCWGWPDEAWDERENKGQQLMVVTYRDSEPWVELWWTGKGYEAIQHHT